MPRRRTGIRLCQDYGSQCAIKSRPLMLCDLQNEVGGGQPEADTRQNNLHVRPPFPRGFFPGVPTRMTWVGKSASWTAALSPPGPDQASSGRALAAKSAAIHTPGMRFSFVVMRYNQEAFVRAAVTAALAQDWPAD